MIKDLEICVKSLVSFEEMKKNMIDLGFHIQEDFVLNDIYMVPKGVDISLKNEHQLFSNYILIRETVGKQKLLVIKRKEIDEQGKIINQESIKCPITDISKAFVFMEALGYQRLFEIQDHNILMSNGKNEIYLQEIPNLGVYLEMEQKNLLLDNHNGETIEELILNLNQYPLKIDSQNYFVKKASDALKEYLEKKHSSLLCFYEFLYELLIFF